jgi:cysteine desulfuration protein SufE
MPETPELIADTIVQEFSEFGDDWTLKYEFLMEQAMHLEPFPDKYRLDAFLIPGCQSQVWLAVELTENRYHFFADSDALITKGMIALLLRVVQNQTAAAISATSFDYITKIGFHTQLSPTRANGLRSMIQRIKQKVV